MGSLSGITSLVSPLLSFTGLPGGLVSLAGGFVAQEQARKQLRQQQDMALDQLRAQQAQAESTSAQNAALEKQRLEAEAKAGEARRASALRRAVARQKTLFSAQGLSGADSGSNEAVLLGLYNDSAVDADEDARLSALRSAALDQNLTQQKQKNLLEAAQLAERQSLARILQGY